MKSNISPRANGIRFPDRTAHGYEEFPVGDEGELGCIVPYGKTRHQHIDADNLILHSDIWSLHTRLWMHHYMIHGLLETGLYNLGPASNGYEVVSYQVNSVSGTTANLTGPDPRRIVKNVPRENPNWPLAAPDDWKPDSYDETQWDAVKTARLIPTFIEFKLPVGSEFKMAFPSIMHSRALAMVVSIDYPTGDYAEEQTFDVELSQDMASALDPYDANNPPTDGYYCGIRFYLPSYWFANAQEPVEQQFALREIMVAKPDMSSSYELLDSQGSSTRVLLPSMGGEIRIKYKLVGEDDLLDYGAFDEEDISFPDDGSTVYDMSDLDAISNLQYVLIRYLPQANAQDTWIFNAAGTCANDQYVHSEDTRRCMAIGCGKFQEGGYEPGGCWINDDADEFTLTEPALAIHDARSIAWISRLWNRRSFYLRQTAVGQNGALNYKYERPAFNGHSFAELMGNYVDELPVESTTPSTEPAFRANLGIYNEVEDDGNTNIALELGIYSSRDAWNTDGTWVQIDDDQDERHPRHGQNSIGLVDYELGPSSIHQAEAPVEGFRTSTADTETASNVEDLF